jgi:hypothetical protein
MSITLIQTQPTVKMYSPGLGFARFLWNCTRPLLGAIALQLLIVSLIVHMPQVSNDWKNVVIGTCLWWPMLLMVMFTTLDRNISTMSPYPAYLFQLPVRTRSLALWPAFYGGAMMMLTWICFDGLVLIPMGWHMPVLWPGLLAAATLLCAQAFSWTSLRWLQLPLAVLGFGGNVFFGIYGISAHLSPILMTAVYLSVIAIAVSFNTTNIAHLRQGDRFEWPANLNKLLAASQTLISAWTLPRPPFRSAKTAQIWLELQSSKFLMPCVYGWIAVCSLALLVDHTFAPLGIVPGVSDLHVRVWVTALFWIFALTSFGGIGVSDISQTTIKKNLTLTSFYAARPMTTSTLSTIKLHVALRTTLATWAVFAPFFLLALVLPAAFHDQIAPLGLLLLYHATLKTVLLTLIGIAFLFYMSLKSTADGLYASLAGRQWIVFASTIPAGVVFIALITGWMDSITHPVRFAHTIKILPYAIEALAFVKIVLACWLISKLLKKDLISVQFLATASIAYVALAAALYEAISYVFPHSTIPFWQIAAGIVLLLPAVRISFLPLALQWNRHR